MTKLLSPLRLILALATVFTATGCELYFGGHNDSGGGGDRWTYCGSDGYYVCQGDNCEWAGARCPDDPNYTCASNADCAAGCFCATSGVCEEAGFCGNDQDCPAGYTCDEARASCVPDGPQACTQDVDCPEAQYCQDGVCTASCSCTSDADAQAQGWGYCDELRGTCEPTPPYGTCAAPATTCTLQPPTCPVGQVPLTDASGCYLGGCLEINLCDVVPACQSIQHEGDCLDNTGCTTVYNGINCTNANGACHAGDTGCNCESFQYASCTTHTLSRTVVDSSTGFVDAASYLSH